MAAMRVITSLLVLLATLLTWVATWDCKFFTTQRFHMSTSTSDITTRANSYGLLLVQGYGTDVLQSIDHEKDVRSNGACVPYVRVSDIPQIFSEFDGYMWAAAVFGVLAIIVSFSMLISVCLPCCKGMNKGMSGGAFFMFVFSMCEFLSLKSTLCVDAMSCALGTAGQVNIAASVLWFALSAAYCFLTGVDNEEGLPK